MMLLNSFSITHKRLRSQPTDIIKLILDHTQVHNRPVLIQTQGAIKSIPSRTLTHGLATDPC